MFKLASAFNLSPIPGEDKYRFSKEEIIVVTPEKNYSAYDIVEMLSDMGQPLASREYASILKRGVLSNLRAPGVDTFLVGGTNFPQDKTYYYVSVIVRAMSLSTSQTSLP